MTAGLKFNIEKLFADLGGPTQVARILGTSRTTPYRIMRSGSIQTAHLTKLKEHKDFNIDDYVIDTTTNTDNNTETFDDQHTRGVAEEV